jgi:hypothetical protein
VSALGRISLNDPSKLACLRHGCLKCLCTKLGYRGRGSGACNRTAGQNEAWLVNRFSICKKQERPRLGDDNLVTVKHHGELNLAAHGPSY